MKINCEHKEFARKELEKGRESKYIKRSLIKKGLSKTQAANCVKKQMKGSKPHRQGVIDSRAKVLEEVPEEFKD